MLSNTLEFRDDAGNEIAFFEKKKKRKCGQSVAMVSAWQFSRQQIWLNQRWYLLLQGDATWGPRRSCCYTSSSLSGQEKLRQHFSTCRWSLHCIDGNPSLSISQPSLLSDFFIAPNFFYQNCLISWTSLSIPIRPVFASVYFPYFTLNLWEINVRWYHDITSHRFW